MSDSTSETKSGRLIPVTKWTQFHPWPSIGGLRHLIFYADKNGFDYCLVRVGRRLLIDENRFFEWAHKQGGWVA